MTVGSVAGERPVIRHLKLSRRITKNCSRKLMVREVLCLFPTGTAGWIADADSVSFAHRTNASRAFRQPPYLRLYVSPGMREVRDVTSASRGWRPRCAQSSTRLANSCSSLADEGGTTRPARSRAERHDPKRL